MNRFVYAQPLQGRIAPPGIEPTDLLAEMTVCARFASLLPGISAASLVTGAAYDMWATCEQTLQLGGAGRHERAVLLANVLLGNTAVREVWVLLGMSMRDGPTAFVLTSLPEHGERSQLRPAGQGHRLVPRHRLLLWDPGDGRCYSCTDPAVPLSLVGTAFNQHNIWLNKQV